MDTFIFISTCLMFGCGVAFFYGLAFDREDAPQSFDAEHELGKEWERRWVEVA